MSETVSSHLNLVWVCTIAFVLVMLILSFLAWVIYLVEKYFPYRKSDEEVIREVLQQAVGSAHPGARVVSMHETLP